MNIFVAKLAAATRGDDLKSLFEAFGRVDTAKVIIDRETNRSKGYGFVEMPDDEEARNAISSLNETEFQGSRIVVKEAVPRPDGERPAPRRFNPRN